MIKNRKTLLFFTSAVMLSDIERARADALEDNLKVNVKIRNGSVPMNGNPEPCDFVAGNAPAEYVKQFPYVDEQGNVNAPSFDAPPTLAHGLTEAATAGSEKGPETSLESEIGNAPGGTPGKAAPSAW